MTVLRHLLLSVFLLLASHAQALIETYDFSSPELEARYQQLSEELRCPKCQNQNIADSNAPIAQDLRKLLHQQLEAGASDAEILDHLGDHLAAFGIGRLHGLQSLPVLHGRAVLLLLEGGHP